MDAMGFILITTMWVNGHLFPYPAVIPLVTKEECEFRAVRIKSISTKDIVLKTNCYPMNLTKDGAELDFQTKSN